ncbi:hypothetical protein K1T71_006799 [Dendrolimus kikuchii]|uniref:Uncharacterized protein n=1 Tax=Dendrolimus kikuchii TaxID=765133 RepID=A0ACC1D256_9NEOP|nr:hypothetical protein K1T71_006799 [Dendrolimus kikuchii]
MSEHNSRLLWRTYSRPGVVATQSGSLLKSQSTIFLGITSVYNYIYINNNLVETEKILLLYVLTIFSGFVCTEYPDFFLLSDSAHTQLRTSFFRCGSTTCIGVAGAQLSVSIMTLVAAIFMLQLDLRYDAALSPPPRPSDAQICTAVSMVPLTSVAINSGHSGEGDPSHSPLSKEKEAQLAEPT